MLKDNLIMLRKFHGYSQEEIAERIGISRQAYGKWEKGDTIPDIEKSALLASVYDITIDGLLKTEQLDDKRTILPAPKGKHIFGTVTVSERGQVVIPKAARKVFRIDGGERLILLGDEEEGLALIKEKTFMEKMNDAMRIATEELNN